MKALIIRLTLPLARGGILTASRACQPSHPCDRVRCRADRSQLPLRGPPTAGAKAPPAGTRGHRAGAGVSSGSGRACTGPGHHRGDRAGDTRRLPDLARDRPAAVAAAPGPMRPHAIASFAAPLAAATLAACGSAQGKSTATARPPDSTPVGASAASTPSAAVKPCGSAGAETLARTAGVVARRIYANELASSEVFSDKRQVEGFSPLLSALQSGNRAAVKEAVTSLVFSHTHVVRLRVTR